MERKIGEIFEYNGEWYQCIPDTTDANCNNCFFQKSCSDITGDCSSTARSDGKSVAFKKLEKVGEPFYRRWTLEGNNKLMQRYKIYTTPLITIDKQRMFYNLTDDLLEIEIKQNKEDMEEKGQCCDNRFEVIAKAKEALLKETNIARDEKEMAVIDNILFRCWQMGWLDKYDDTEHSNSEKIGKNLKPFDLQKAIEGKPVCTKDGRKARIVCFDRVDAKPILALIASTDGKCEDVFDYFISGKRIANAFENDLDLMMLTEKKEGWVNVYKGGLLDTKSYNTRKEAFDKASPEDYVDTIKINWSE